MKNISNKTKTILFASVIAAMILPFSTMDFADAQPSTDEHTEKKDILAQEKKSFQEKLEKTTDNEERKKLSKVLKRIDLFDEVVDIQQQEQNDESNKRLGEIYQELLASYSEDENGIRDNNPSKVSNLENPFMPLAYAYSSGSYSTSTQYRSDCSAGVYGNSNGTYEAETTTDFDQNWSYPSTLKSNSDCNYTWDIENYSIIVFGFQIYCYETSTSSSDSFTCAASEGRIVTIWANAHYDSPIPGAQQAFTEVPGVAVKVL